jgi:hypothetical protein
MSPNQKHKYPASFPYSKTHCNATAYSGFPLNDVQNVFATSCSTCTSAFEVCKSVHYHTIQINQPTRCNSFTNLLLDVYVWLNMFWASPLPSSTGYNCTRNLWFYHWNEAVITCQTMTNNAPAASFQW